jgi:16S rRNA (cytidine1402-2'-O)-methyltransferase
MTSETPAPIPLKNASSPPQWTLQGHVFNAQSLVPGLYVVATPIGNLGDITFRALSTLAACDMILAEDTRVIRRLLDHYGIQTQVRRFDAHASAAQIEAITTALVSGGSYALVSDAGTPLISDPGSSLVTAVVSAGVKVIPVPGASAMLAALVAGGLASDRFFFEGFLPPKSGDRKRRLRLLASVPGAIVLYEAPHRVLETLKDCEAVLGDRQAVAARELTKLYETVVRGPLSAIAQHFETENPRGEFVLIISQPSEGEALGETDIDSKLAELIQSMSVKDAAAVVAGEMGLPKREVYARALRLSGKAK